MLDLLSYGTFIDFPPISDHRPLLIKGTPNYKASGPDGIPIEFYKALIPPDNENSVINSASGLNCLQKIYSRI